MNRYEGDPKIFIDNDGAFFIFRSGQPVMEQGFENQVNISLLTKPGWFGNHFLKKESQIGSNFLENTQGSITLRKLNNIRQSAEQTLKSPSFGRIDVNVRNPESHIVDTEIIIRPPGKDIQKITIKKNGINWINQISSGR